MIDSKYRYLVPNSVTFLSLACGIVAILSAATGSLSRAGVLILASYILDLLDGELARRLDASSEFGLQLDSLADMVGLGVAPAVLAFFHLQAEGVSSLWAWPAVIAVPLAGAFRLARFNLLPVKEGQVDSVGLTISTAGATLTLAVLSDIANANELMADFLFAPLMFLLSGLMVSRISFPAITWVFSRRRLNLLYAVLIGASLFWLPFVNVWFLFNGGYLSVGLARAGLQAFGE